MASNFTADEVFIKNVKDTNGQVISISNNILTFPNAKTGVIGITMWRLTNNSTGEQCVATFPGITLDCQIKEGEEIIHKGEMIGENTEGKTPYVLIMGNEGGIGMLFSVV